jgi:hypothetical protein
MRLSMFFYGAVIYIFGVVRVLVVVAVVIYTGFLFCLSDLIIFFPTHTLFLTLHTVQHVLTPLIWLRLLDSVIIV